MKPSKVRNSCLGWSCCVVISLLTIHTSATVLPPSPPNGVTLNAKSMQNEPISITPMDEFGTQNGLLVSRKRQEKEQGTDCEDKLHKFQDENNQWHGCSWINGDADKTEERRQKYCYERAIVLKQCPAACGWCGDKCEDYKNFKFKIWDDSMQGCDWIKRHANQEKINNRLEKWCDPNQDVPTYSYCAKTCNYQQCADAKYEWNQIGQSMKLADLNEGCTNSSSIDISNNGAYFIIGCPSTIVDGNADVGSVSIFKRGTDTNIHEWNKEITINGDQTGDFIGREVSFAKDNAFIFAYSGVDATDGPHRGKGIVRVIKLSKGANDEISKIQLGQDILDTKSKQFDERFRINMSGDGKTIVLSTLKSQITLIYRYNDDNDNWDELPNKLPAQDTNVSISLSNDAKFLGVGNPASNEFLVYDVDNQSSIAEIENGKFGTSVSLSNDGKISAIGAPMYGCNNVNTKNCGRIWFISSDGAIIDAVEGSEEDKCGIDVDLSSDGGTVVIGCNDKAIIATLDNTKWTVAKTISLTASMSLFKNSVDVTTDGATVAIKNDGTLTFYGLLGVERPSDAPSSFPSFSVQPSSTPSSFPSFSVQPSLTPSSFPSLSPVPSSSPSKSKGKGKKMGKGKGKGKKKCKKSKGKGSKANRNIRLLNNSKGKGSKKNEEECEEENEFENQCEKPSDANKKTVKWTVKADGDIDKDELNSLLCKEKSDDRFRRLSDSKDKKVEVLSVQVTSLEKEKEDCEEECLFYAEMEVFYSGDKETKETVITKKVTYYIEKQDLPHEIELEKIEEKIETEPEENKTEQEENETEPSIGKTNSQQTNSLENGVANNNLPFWLLTLGLILVVIIGASFFIYGRRQSRDEFSKFDTTIDLSYMSETNSESRRSSSISSKHLQPNQLRTPSVMRNQDGKNSIGKVAFPITPSLIDKDLSDNDDISEFSTFLSVSKHPASVQGREKRNLQRDRRDELIQEEWNDISVGSMSFERHSS